MVFSGTFELADAIAEEMWLASSAPDPVRQASSGCRFHVRGDDDPDFEALREGREDREPDLTLGETTISNRFSEEAATLRRARDGSDRERGSEFPTHRHRRRTRPRSDGRPRCGSVRQTDPPRAARSERLLGFSS